MNCSYDIYPFDDCSDNRCCCGKSDVMILSAVSALQKDVDKLSEKTNNTSNELSKITWTPLMIDLK